MRVRDDRQFLHWLAVCLAVCVNFLAVGVAKADGLPPPQTFQQVVQQAPTGSTISGRLFPGGDFRASIPNEEYIRNQSGRTYNNAKFVGGSAGGVIHGVKKMDGLFTDTHGATARGSFQTTTAMPSNDRLAKLSSGLLAGMIAGNVASSNDMHKAAAELGNGNYAEGTAYALAGLDWTGLGHAFHSLKDSYNAAVEQKARGVIGDAEAQNASTQYNPQYSTVRVFYFSKHGTNENNGEIFRTQLPNVHMEVSGGVIYFYQLVNGHQKNYLHSASHSAPGVSYYTHNVVFKDIPNNPDLWRKPLTLEDILLTQAEIEALILQQLQDNNSVLRQNTKALTNFLNALSASGGLNETNTTTTVDNGGTAQTTFLTAPYTPFGSNQAQQTQFVVNKDGSVTATTIARPDLAANTSQAPTRAPIGQTATTTATTAPKETATPEAPDICANNPNSLMCADMGSADYSDPVIPEHAVNMDFAPANIFNTDGVCPKPLSFNVMGQSFAISYEPACDFSRMVRPIIVLAAMVSAMGMAYATVRSL